MTTRPIWSNDSARVAFLRACDVLDTAPEPAFDAATELASRICDAPMATVTLVDEQRQWFKSRVGIELSETPRSMAFCDHTVGSAEFLMVPDAAADERFADNPLVTAEPFVRFYGGAPLITADGLILGTVAVMDTRPRTLTARQQDMLAAVARQVSAALDMRHELAQQKRAIVQHADDALRSSEAQYRAMVESSPDLICRFRPDTTLTYVNGAYCRMFGRSREDLIGTRIIELVPDEDQARIAAELENLRPDMAPRSHTERMILPDGRRRWFHWTEAAVRDAAGHFLEYQGVGRDVTEVRRSEQALRESEARFRQLAASISEVFWLSTAARDALLYVSPSYERVWGRRAEDLYEDRWDWLQAVHPDDREWVRHAATFQQAASHYEVEYRLLRPDGEIRWIRDRGFPVRDEQGRVFRMAGVAEDVTARRRLEEQLRQTQKLESVGQLAAGVAHDFNNLLTVIHGNVALLQEQFGLESEPGEPSELLAQVADAASSGAGLTRQLLLFSRREHMQPRLVDLNDQCRHLVSMLQRVLGEEVELELNLDHRLPRVHADAGMLDQVITNVALNARDAMPRGGTLRLETRTYEVSALEAARLPEARPGSFVRLSVTDTGEGIAPEHLPHLFEPFFTTKKAGSGTGLGLATAYGIVAQHGGWIDVSSKVGQGTTMAILLPAAGPAAPERAAQQPAVEIPGGTETVLVVEDEPGLLDLAVRVLAGRGYQVLTATSGQEGLDVWRTRGEEVDLLLSDIVLPGGLRGHEMAARCRETRPGLKVLYMSGYRGDLPDEGLVPRDVSGFLQKPFKPSQLLAAVRALLDRDSRPA